MSCSLLIVVQMSCLTCSSSAAELTILKFISSETPPFWSHRLNLDGMCGEMLHEISREFGAKTEITYKPTTRMIESVGSNLLGNPEFFLADHEFEAIIPIAVSRLALFYYNPHHDNEIRYQKLSDLKGYTIGVMKGSLTHADMSFFERSGIQFEESYSKESLFKKLRLGRIDLCIEVELSGLLVIDSLFHEESEKFERLEIQRSNTAVSVMIDKDYPNSTQLGEKIKNGLDQIIKDGRYKEILGKYYGKSDIPSDWFYLLEHYRNMYDFYIKSQKTW